MINKLRELLKSVDDFESGKPIQCPSFIDVAIALRQMVADMKEMREALEHADSAIPNSITKQIVEESLTQTEKYLPLFEEVKL